MFLPLEEIYGRNGKKRKFSLNLKKLTIFGSFGADGVWDWGDYA